MKPNEPRPHLSAVIAAARLRRPRGASGSHGGEGGRGKPKNNYLAEEEPSLGKIWGNQKGAGARPGNLNAVHIPHRTPEEIALYRRYAAFLRGAKITIAQARATLRARRAEKRAPR